MGRSRLCCLFGLLVGCSAEFGAKASLGPDILSLPAPPVADASTTGTLALASGQRTDRVMVRPVDGAELEHIAADHGATVAEIVGRSGVGALEVPASESAVDFLEQLLQDDRVEGVFRESWFTGAAVDAVGWHLTVIGAEDGPAAPVEDVVVAVIDSGIAWGRKSGVGQVQADTLGQTPVASPWDFVDQDSHPQDEHQHGTHMASIIASSGAVQGVAPGATLMPLRVLDAQNQGSELALVEALHWATDRGADVINLSLSFWPGYQPSVPLQAALDHAASAGVLLVAASGNDGWDGVSWPAASPLVLAVGASCLGEDGKVERAPYSNHGAEVDLLAPGGCLDRDVDEDGLVDGIVAETIRPGSSGTGLYLWSGTSQAAAVVSGAAARLIADGASPQQAGRLLTDGADLSRVLGIQSELRVEAGIGHGALWIAGLDAADRPVEGERLGSILPVLATSGARDFPMARVSIIDRGALPIEAAQVWVRADGSGGTGLSSCTTDALGHCDVAFESLGGRGIADAALDWTLTIVAVSESDGRIHRPSAYLHAAAGLELLVDAADAAGDLTEELLAWRWEAGNDPVFGPLADAWTFVDLTSGITRAPSAVLGTVPAIEAHGQQDDDTLDLDGSGIATSPLGLLPLKRVSLAPIGGSGLATSPLGLTPVRSVGVSAADLFDAIGTHPADAHDVSGSGIATSPLGVAEGPVALDEGAALAWTPDSGALVGRLEEGGLRAAGEAPAVEALVGVGLALERGWQGIEGSGASAPVSVPEQ